MRSAMMIFQFIGILVGLGRNGQDEDRRMQRVGTNRTSNLVNLFGLLGKTEETNYRTYTKFMRQ